MNGHQRRMLINMKTNFKKAKKVKKAKIYLRVVLKEIRYH